MSKVHRIISIILYTFQVFVFYSFISCTHVNHQQINNTISKESELSEKLFGTWLCSQPSYPMKIVLTSEGNCEYYFSLMEKEPIRHGIYKVEKEWKDEDGYETYSLAYYWLDSLNEPKFVVNTDIADDYGFAKISSNGSEMVMGWSSYFDPRPEEEAELFQLYYREGTDLAAAVEDVPRASEYVLIIRDSPAYLIFMGIPNEEKYEEVAEYIITEDLTEAEAEILPWSEFADRVKYILDKFIITKEYEDPALIPGLKMMLSFEDQVQIGVSWHSGILISRSDYIKSEEQYDEYQISLGNEPVKLIEQPLFDLIQTGTVEEIKNMLETGINVNAIDKNGRTLLMLAVKENVNPEIIKILLEAGVDVNARGGSKMTALIYAAGSNTNPDVIKILLEAGADINAIGTYGATPIINAARNQNLEILPILLDAGADVNFQTTNGFSPLICASGYNTNPEAIQILLDAGANIEATFHNGITPLMQASQFNTNPEVIKFLIDAGEDVNARNNEGCTPLMFAAKDTKNPEIISVLLELGANIELKDDIGRSVFYYARHNRNIEGTPVYLKLKDEAF